MKTEILNYQRYFKACEIELGIHGPEIYNDKLYISIYHYLEYKGEFPKSYNTFDLVAALTSVSNGDYKICKYKCQSFKIHKFTLEILQANEGIFKNYLRH